MKKFTKSVLFLLLVSIFLGASLFVGCRNPFMPDAPVDAMIPTISVQPKDSTVLSDAKYTVSVSATVTDGGTLSYQWYEANDEKSEGVLIEGETKSSLQSTYLLQNNETEKIFYYYVVVTNTNNNATGTKTATVTSTRAKVTVNTLINAKAPTITEQPTGYNDTKPESYTLTVKATVSDEGKLSYQWYKNDVAIEGATSSSYVIPEADLVVGTNEYYVVVTNTNNNVNGEKTASVTSDKATVTIIQTVNAATPVISNQPQNTSIDDGDSFVLSVVASVTDGGSLSYQWYIAEDASSEGKAISGETKATLSTIYDLKDYNVAEDVYYYVVVTNTNNSVNGNTSTSVTSSRAKVTVNEVEKDHDINIDFN